MDSSIFTWFIDKIIENKALKLAEKKDKSAIISALSLSIMKTDKHITLQRDKVTEKDVYSEDLMTSWNKVAELVRPYDSDLAKLFDSKSKYWYDPEKFKTEIQTRIRKFDFRFRLNEVKKIEEELNQIWFG